MEPPLLTLEKTNSTDLCSWSVIMWSGYTLALCNNPRGLAPQGTGRLRIVSSVREGFLFGRGGCFSGFSLRLNRFDGSQQQASEPSVVQISRRHDWCTMAQAPPCVGAMSSKGNTCLRHHFPTATNFYSPPVTVVCIDFL